MKNKKNKSYLIYFILLFIVVTGIFVSFFDYSYRKQEELFLTDNMEILKKISQKLDNSITQANSAAYAISIERSTKALMVQDDSSLTAEYKKLYDKLQEYITALPYINSIYVYFKNHNKILTNNTLYRYNDFYDKSFINSLNSNNLSGIWLKSRTITTDMYTYIKPTNVISIFSKLPNLVENPTTFIAINIDQRTLLDTIKNYTNTKNLVICYNDKIIATFDNSKIGKTSGIDTTSSDNFGVYKSGGNYIFYTPSQIKNLSYVNTINHVEFDKLFSPNKYVIILMYLTSILALTIVYNILSRLSRKRFGYLTTKLYQQLNPDEVNKPAKNQFEELDMAIDDFVLQRKHIEEKIQSYNHIVKNMLILDLITGNAFLGKQFSQKLEYSAISFCHPCFIVIVTSIIDSQNYYDINEEAYSKNVLIKEIIEVKLNLLHPTFSALIDNERIGFIVNHSNIHDQIMPDLMSLLQSINTEIKNQFELSLLFSIGSSVNSVEDIGKSYYIANKNLSFKSVSDSNLIISQESDIIESPSFPISLSHKIVNGFKSNNPNLVKESINYFFESYIKNNKLYLENLKNITTMFFCKTIFSLWENEFELNLIDSFEIINSIDEKNSARELNAYLNDLFVGFLERHNTFSDENNSTGTLYLTKVISFINSNYAKDISISDISECVNLNPRYLGTLFKNSTGKTMIEYLTTLRIKNSKVLLSDKNKPIKDIALEVGYNDTHAFIRNFKKILNVTPTEYRENLK